MFIGVARAAVAGEIAGVNEKTTERQVVKGKKVQQNVRLLPGDTVVVR